MNEQPNNQSAGLVGVGMNTQPDTELSSLAKKAVQKNWSFEQLKYGDDLYGREHLADAVFELVEECKLIGTVAFNEKYPTP